jgi:hypothetical protein
VNPLLFASCTNTFSKWCKITRGCPYEHKISGINYLVNRLNTQPITKKAKEKEPNIIRKTVQNNEYNVNSASKQNSPLSLTLEKKQETTKLIKALQ